MPPVLTPVLAIVSPPNGSTVMPDFSVTGQCSNYEGGKVQCELAQQTTPPSPNPVIITVEAGTTPDPMNPNDVNWEAVFSAVPIGLYAVTAFYESTLPSATVGYTVTVQARKDDVGVEMTQVYTTTGAAAGTERLVVKGWRAAPAAGTLHCYITYNGRVVQTGTPEPDPAAGEWAVTFDVPPAANCPFVIHAVVVRDGRTHSVAKSFAIVAGPPATRPR